MRHIPKQVSANILEWIITWNASTGPIKWAITDSVSQCLSLHRENQLVDIGKPIQILTEW